MLRLTGATVAVTTESAAKVYFSANAAYQRVLHAHGLIGSMSRAGNCWDLAVVESFFTTLKTEPITRRS